jgi:uncharacterized protein (DUF1810 family)
MADLQRFIEAQAKDYAPTLVEIKNGKKVNHWMWYIFPQIHGLGFSETSIFYAIQNKNEAEEYLTHPVLGRRLIEISNALLTLATKDALEIFGSPDDLKLKSSMTLFASVKDADTVFQSVLDKFFKGEKDGKTIELLGGEAVG